MMGSLGSVVAEGFAFGTGSAIAHRAVGSLFGGSSYGYGGAPPPGEAPLAPPAPGPEQGGGSLWGNEMDELDGDDDGGGWFDGFDSE